MVFCFHNAIFKVCLDSNTLTFGFYYNAIFEVYYVARHYYEYFTFIIDKFGQFSNLPNTS